MNYAFYLVQLAIKLFLLAPAFTFQRKYCNQIFGRFFSVFFLCWQKEIAREWPQFHYQLKSIKSATENTMENQLLSFQSIFNSVENENNEKNKIAKHKNPFIKQC